VNAEGFLGGGDFFSACREFTELDVCYGCFSFAPDFQFYGSAGGHFGDALDEAGRAVNCLPVHFADDVIRFHAGLFRGAAWLDCLYEGAVVVRQSDGFAGWPRIRNADAEETGGFVDGMRTWGLIGASYYTWPGITDAQWAQLEQVPANPVGDPPLPVRPGAPALGNVPGADTTHPHEVAYVLSGRAGDRSLTFEAFDPGPDEIVVWVNGSPIATVPAGSSDAWTPEPGCSSPGSTSPS
jgi:hypothetical protein